jgi:hypothetical protein
MPLIITLNLCLYKKPKFYFEIKKQNYFKKFLKKYTTKVIRQSIYSKYPFKHK